MRFRFGFELFLFIFMFIVKNINSVKKKLLLWLVIGENVMQYLNILYFHLAFKLALTRNLLDFWTEQKNAK